MKPIPGFEGRYSATEDGGVYSHVTNKVIKPKNHPNGYLMVCLIGDDGSRNYELVHRLVCKAYHGVPDGKLDVNHIDCNKKNNVPSNLEWCTRSENMQHAIRHGLLEGQRAAVSRACLERGIPVVGYSESGDAVVTFRSMEEARRNGFPKVSEVIRGLRNKTGGLYWRRATPDEVGL